MTVAAGGVMMVEEGPARRPGLDLQAGRGRVAMDSLGEFLRRLFREGRVVFAAPPGPAVGPVEGTVAALREAYGAYAPGVAGPAIPLDPAVATAAAEVVRQACWALVHRGERPEDLARRLAMPRPPVSPSDHLSADLVFRYLPGVHRRARGVDPADPLTAAVAGLLRRWPLSGVLADLDDGPAEPPDLGGHPGLLLLYAERLARDDRDAWRPSARGMEYVELVAAGTGRR